MGASWFQKVLKNGTFGSEFAEYSQKITDCQREFMFGNSIMMTTMLATMASNMDTLRIELNQARLNDATILQKKQKEIARSASMGNSLAADKIEKDFTVLMNKEMKEIMGGEQLEVTMTSKLPLVKKGELKFNGELGRGAYGIVYSALWRGETVAAKSLGADSSNLTPKEAMEFKKEAGNLFSLNHPSIIKLLAAVYEETDLMLVMEIAEKGTLKDAIEENVLDNSFIWYTMLGLAKGMQYLYQQGMSHRDLKTDNVLLNRYYDPKIVDFGFSGNIASLNDLRQGGTFEYMAPELLSAGFNHVAFNEKCDVYSYAVMCWEMVERDIPYRGRKKDAIQANLMQGHRLPFQNNNNADPDMVSLISSCWHQDASQRPTFEEITTFIMERVPSEYRENTLYDQKRKELAGMRESRRR
jgi:predicted Ser/Thr protein kinase